MMLVAMLRCLRSPIIKLENRFLAVRFKTYFTCHSLQKNASVDGRVFIQGVQLLLEGVSGKLKSNSNQVVKIPNASSRMLSINRYLNINAANVANLGLVILFKLLQSQELVPLAVTRYLI